MGFIKKLLNLFYNRIYLLLINFKLIRSKVFIVNGTKVKFHNIRDSSLLKNISINGFESHENEVIKLIKKYNWNLECFYDIGSNVGHYSVIASLYHKNTCVYSVEPFPLSAKYIEKLKSDNNLSFSVVQKAVDNSNDEEKEFYFPTSKYSSKLPGTATLINSFKGSGGIFKDLPFKTTKVKTVTLSRLMKDCNKDALVKIDCEGNEFNILSDSPILDKDNIDFIVEIMINDSDKNDIFNIMKNHGYNGFLITNAGLIHEDRALTLPKPNRSNRTLWRNHFFTKKPISEIREFSKENYGYWI